MKSQVAINNKMYDKIKSKLGAPVLAFELTDQQLDDLYQDAIRNWDLYRPLSKREKKELSNMFNDWVEGYFQALVKEAISNVRGKFGGSVPIPGGDLKLDYKELKDDSVREKNHLVRLVLNDKDFFDKEEVKMILAYYINIGNMDDKEVEGFLKQIRDQVSEDSAIPGLKQYFIPVRDRDTSIECVYPQFISNEKLSNILENNVKDMNKALKSLSDKLVKHDENGVVPGRPGTIIKTDKKDEK